MCICEIKLKSLIEVARRFQHLNELNNKLFCLLIMERDKDLRSNYLKAIRLNNNEISLIKKFRSDALSYVGF